MECTASFPGAHSIIFSIPPLQHSHVSYLEISPLNNPWVLVTAAGIAIVVAKWCGHVTCCFISTYFSYRNYSFSWGHQLATTILVTLDFSFERLIFIFINRKRKKNSPETFVLLFFWAGWHSVYASTDESLQYSANHHHSYQLPEKSASPKWRQIKESITPFIKILGYTFTLLRKKQKCKKKVR